MNKCLTPSGWCTYEARYDYNGVPSESIIELIKSKCNLKVALKIIEALTEKIYVKDICTQCGRETQRYN